MARTRTAPATTTRTAAPRPTGDSEPLTPDEVNARHSESTPSGSSYHAGDPDMGDLPHRVQPDPDGRYTVDVHVTPDGHARIGDRLYTPEEFADVLRRNGDYDGRPVRLIGCDASSNDFAHRLSRELDTEVMAPTKPAWTDSHGRVFSSDYEIGPDGRMRPRIPPDGEWNTHRPDGSTHAAGDDGFAPDTRHHDPHDVDADSARHRGDDDTPAARRRRGRTRTRTTLRQRQAPPPGTDPDVPADRNPLSRQQEHDLTDPVRQAEQRANPQHRTDFTPTGGEHVPFGLGSTHPDAPRAPHAGERFPGDQQLQPHRSYQVADADGRPAAPTTPTGSGRSPTSTRRTRTCRRGCPTSHPNPAYHPNPDVTHPHPDTSTGWTSTGTTRRSTPTPTACRTRRCSTTGRTSKARGSTSAATTRTPRARRTPSPRAFPTSRTPATTSPTPTASTAAPSRPTPTGTSAGRKSTRGTHARTNPDWKGIDNPALAGGAEVHFRQRFDPDAEVPLHGAADPERFRGAQVHEEKLPSGESFLDSRPKNPDATSQLEPNSKHVVSSDYREDKTKHEQTRSVYWTDVSMAGSRWSRPSGYALPGPQQPGAEHGLQRRRRPVHVPDRTRGLRRPAADHGAATRTTRPWRTRTSCPGGTARRRASPDGSARAWGSTTASGTSPATSSADRGELVNMMSQWRPQNQGWPKQAEPDHWYAI